MVEDPAVHCVCRLAAMMAAFGTKGEPEPPVSAEESLSSFGVPLMAIFISLDSHP